MNIKSYAYGCKPVFAYVRDTVLLTSYFVEYSEFLCCDYTVCTLTSADIREYRVYWRIQRYSFRIYYPFKDEAQTAVFKDPFPTVL